MNDVNDNVARVLTNETLAHRLDLLRLNRRQFSKREVDAYLREAGRRLLRAGTLGVELSD